jgi:hypothetical protein
MRWSFSLGTWMATNYNTNESYVIVVCDDGTFSLEECSLQSLRELSFNTLQEAKDRCYHVEHTLFHIDDENHPESHTMADGVYFHGTVEAAAGFDIVALNENHSMRDYFTQCETKQVFAYGLECTMFTWRCDRNRIRGLVVANNDQEAMEYARQAFREKRDSL